MSNTTVAPPNTNVQPTYLSSLFPNGLPSTQAATAGTPSASAYTSQLATANPYLASTSNVSTQGLGANALVQQILGAMQPGYQQQDQALTQNLANAGIVGGSTGGALTDLSSQQNASTAAALAPYEQTAQQTQLGANEFNATANNANAATNASALNANAQYNSTNALQNNQYNASALNSNSQYNATNDLGANEFNAGQTNQVGLDNTTNSLTAASTDASTANTIMGQVMGLNNTDYLQQLQNQLALAQGTQQSTTQAYQPIYQQPTAPNFSGLAGAFGSNTAANTAQSSGSTTYPNYGTSEEPDYGASTVYGNSSLTGG